MIHDIQFAIGLLALIAAATLLGRRIRVQASIVLVVIGVGLSFVPGFPVAGLEPDMVLLVILPPLIYAAGVATSWPDFRCNLRAITLLAVGGVVFTTAVVAAAAHAVMGLAWLPALVLGAVISPPDVIAPMAVVGRIRIPRRLATILNGEGLVNDVTALVLFGFGTAAVVTGSFSAPRALVTFVLVLAGELAWGWALGWASLRLRRWADDVRVEITLSLLTPFAAFWLPHALGGSGVLATAVTGLYASWHGPRLISAATRLQGTFFWNLTVHLLTGFVFLLTGLQARAVLAAIDSGSGWGELALQALAVCGVAIAARFLWVFAATYAPLLGGRERPGWRQPFLVAFTGIRGVVSLAAALSIPLTVAGGAPFPGRNRIIFLTFIVIVATLVVQGLALPLLIRLLGLDKVGADEAVREEAAELASLVAAEQRALDLLQRARRDPGSRGRSQPHARGPAAPCRTGPARSRGDGALGGARAGAHRRAAGARLGTLRHGGDHGRGPPAHRAHARPGGGARPARPQRGDPGRQLSAALRERGWHDRAVARVASRWATLLFPFSANCAG
jgi:Na+/H+ antiporter